MTVDTITLSLAETPPIVIVFEGGAAPTLVVEEQQAFVVALPGVQGPPGAQGPIGPSGGELTAVAGAALNGHRAVAYAPDGRLVLASCDNPDHLLAVAGLIEVSAAEGETVPLRISGAVTLSGWAWSAGPVLLGLNGQLVQDVPAGAVFVQALGRGDGTRLFVDLQPPYSLGA